MIFWIHELLAVMATVPSSRIISQNLQIAEDIFTEYSSYIKNIIRCRVNDKHLRNDIYNDLFLALMNKPFPVEVRKPQAYLYRTVCNCINDALRKVERYQNHLYQHNLEAIRKSSQPSQPDASTSLTASVRLFDVVELSLTPCHANVIKLKYHKKLTNAEIAKKLNIGKGTVRAYCSSGLKKLRKVLRENGELQ